jgi:hypothetical protein
VELKDFSNGPVEAGARHAQKRSVPRYPLIAAVEIYEPLSHTRLAGRTTEIALNGCYVEVGNPLSRNTVVQVHIHQDHRDLRAWARVAYVHENNGMGLAFLGNPADHLPVIADWIQELKA